jgi:hypothetical protein
MLEHRERHAITLLANGNVLVTGGFGASFTGLGEIYSPGTGNWTIANLRAGRADHTATRLNNGTVLLAGGYSTTGPAFGSSAEIYNPVTNTSVAAGTLREPRSRHTATLLLDGSVLLTGGSRSNSEPGAPWASAERYVPGTGFVGAASLS